MMERSLLIGIIALVVILAFPVGVSAETTTFGLNIHINSAMTLSAGTVNFGTLAPGTDATASTTVTITTNAPNWHVDINNGINPESGTGYGRMKSTTGTNYLTGLQIKNGGIYTPIYSGINRILTEGDGASPVLYFKQHVESTTPPGDYSDTYTLTATLD